MFLKCNSCSKYNSNPISEDDNNAYRNNMGEFMQH